MTIQPLNKDDIFYDPVLNLVLRADGQLSLVPDCHEMTMIWPSYSSIDMNDSAIKRMMPATYDHRTNVVEYRDTLSCRIIKLDLNTGKTDSYTLYTIAVHSANKKPPFPIGAVLFHKDTRTKWVFNKVSGLGTSFELRALDDKTKTVSVDNDELSFFEEIFF